MGADILGGPGVMTGMFAVFVTPQITAPDGCALKILVAMLLIAVMSSP